LGAEPLRFGHESVDGPCRRISTADAANGRLEFQESSHLRGTILASLDVLVDATGAPLAEFIVDPTFESVPHTGMV